MRLAGVHLWTREVNVPRNAFDVVRDAFDVHRNAIEEAWYRFDVTSRHLLLLHAHGLLQKVPNSHLDRVTPHGIQSLSTLLAAANISTTEFKKLAVYTSRGGE